MRLRLLIAVISGLAAAPANAQLFGVTETINDADNGNYLHVTKFNPSTQGYESLGSYMYRNGGYTSDFRPQADSYFYDASAEKVFIFGVDGNGDDQRYIEFSLSSNSFSTPQTITATGFGNQERFAGVYYKSKINVLGSSDWVTKDVIRQTSDGAIHIGQNSLVLKEEDGVQKMWATDASGNSIDIDVTNGSDLLINGKSVQGQIDENRSLINANTTQINKNTDNINNLAQGVAASTALTSALSSLPTVSDDSPFSCGVGTGGYSSRAAMGLGCAAKLNDRLSFNLGGSYVFGGTYSYGGGSLDTMAARGGFVFKLGKIDDSPKVAAKKAAKLHDLVSKVQEENQQLKDLLAQQSALLAATQERLERLEHVAGINLSSLGDRASR